MSDGKTDYARWGAVPLALLEDPAVSHRALRVFTVLSAMQGRRRHVQATLGAIALQAHVDERDTRRALALLQSRGWVRRLEAAGKASVFEVLMVRAGPQGEGRITPGCFTPGSEGTPGRITPGRNTPPSSSSCSSPPLRKKQEAEEERPPAPPKVTPAPEGYARWRLRVGSEVGAAVLDKPKTRAAWSGLEARGLDGDEAVAYALAEWSALAQPRRVGHLVQALLDGDHLEPWLARRARRKARQGSGQQELAGPDLAFARIPEKDWMAVVHERRKAGSGGTR